MSNSQNQRKSARLHAFWKVYRDDITWGYLIDLSETGVKVWLNKDEEVNEDNFTIRIRPPREFNIDAIDFEVRRIWMNPNKSLRFNEIGCQFRNLTEDQKKQLTKLITFFEKYNPKEEFTT